MIKVPQFQCSNSGIAYWRLQNFAIATHRLKTEVQMRPVWWDKKLSGSHPWQLGVNKPEQRHMWQNAMNMECADADVILFQVVHTKEALTMFYSIKDAYPNTPIIVEIDDNLLQAPTYNPAHEAYAPGSPFRELAISQFKVADAIVVSTPYLKEVYSEFCDHIYIVPNCIDFEHWDVKKKGKKGLRIGWCGGAAHDMDLKIIQKPMQKIIKDNDNVIFHFVHGIPNFLKDLKNVTYSRKFARIDKYPQYLADQDFDIGLAPLVDNGFNRGKSCLRWLEYSALSIPTVASRVGHFEQSIKDGVDGFLVEDHEWEVVLQQLIDDKKMRRRVGKAAHARVMRDFNTDGITIHYQEVIREILKRGVVKRPEPVADSYIPQEAA